MINQEKQEDRCKKLWNIGLKFNGTDFIYQDINFHWTDIVCMDDDDFEKALIGATARKATLCNCGNCKISATDCPNAAQGGVEPGTLCKHWSDF